MMNSPAEVAKNYIAVGKSKAQNSFSKLLVLGILAGAFIALAGIGCTTVGVTIASPSVAKFAGACIFPVGLAMVLLAGSELFTGNNLIIIPVLTGDVKVSAMLRNWVIVYIGNLIGSILIAFLVVYGHTGDLFGGIDGGLAASILNAANSRVTMPFLSAFFRGICCNFLVCIAVWISFAAKDVAGKFLGLFMPIMLFVLCGFEHSIADMYFVSAGLFVENVYGVDQEALTWGSFFLKNLLPVTLGNIVGGAGLVGMPYWFVYLRKIKSE